MLLAVRICKPLLHMVLVDHLQQGRLVIMTPVNLILQSAQLM